MVEILFRSEFQGLLKQSDAFIPLPTVSMGHSLFVKDVCPDRVEVGYDDQGTCAYDQKGIRPPMGSWLKANGAGYCLDQDGGNNNDGQEKVERI